MKINNIYVSCKRNGEVWSTCVTNTWHRIDDVVKANLLKRLKSVFCSKNYSESYKNELFDKTMKILNDETTSSIHEDTTLIEKSKETISKLINFFSEFQFEPNFRFVNTLCKNVISYGTSSAKDYITNYFSLIDHQYTGSIVEKMKSTEFNELLKDMSSLVCTKSINTRFKVYYGSQGTGKTTKAMEEASNLCMVCHSAMLPADLMEDFKFEDGKPNFQPSALQNAMTTGKKIVLDEINLLPFESLRFLQSILDGKKEFTYKGKVITIADGFQIIGTMNLTVNGCTFSLPEPLVDRACEIRKYKLTADSLIGALV